MNMVHKTIALMLRMHSYQLFWIHFKLIQNSMLYIFLIKMECVLLCKVQQNFDPKELEFIPNVCNFHEWFFRPRPIVLMLLDSNFRFHSQSSKFLQLWLFSSLLLSPSEEQLQK